MDQVAAKIARWKELYFELNDVRTRLRDGPAEAGASTSQLRFELRRLQRESEKALDEVHAAVAAMGSAGLLPQCVSRQAAPRLRIISRPIAAAASASSEAAAAG